MGRKPDIVVRAFFAQVDGKSVCKLCKNVFKGNFITNLRRHLKNVHRDQYNREMNEAESEVEEKKVKFSVAMDPEKMKEACVKLATTEKVPFALFDSECFKFITEQIFSGLNIPPVTSRNVMALIHEEYEKKRSWLMEKTKNKMLCLKVDTAARLHRSILGINVQFYSNTKIVVKTLGIIELTQRHTGNHINIQINNDR